MTFTKGKSKLTIYIDEDLQLRLRHLTVESRSTLSTYIENLIKKAIEWEKVKKV